MSDRLFTPMPLAKGAIPRPLSCQGPGNHSPEGYRCANSGIEGCLGFVCKRCAAKSFPSKPYTEECNVCQLAVQNGCSMTKALAVIAELHPQAVKRGKVTCASTDKNGKPCRRCIRHECRRENCLTDGKPTIFRSHSRNDAYCNDLCRAASRRESTRRANDKRRAQRLTEVA